MSDPLIVDWLTGNLAQEEEEGFLARLRTDQELQRSLVRAAHEQRALRQAVRDRVTRSDLGFQAADADDSRAPRSHRPRIRRPQRRTWLAPLVVMMAAVVVVAVGLPLMRFDGPTPSAIADDNAPRITALSGETLQAGGASLAVGHALAIHEALEVGVVANATLAWRDGTSMRIAGGSRIMRLPGAGQRVQLERGAVAVQAAHRPASAPLEIVCPDATTRVVGTAFVITVQDGRSHLAVSDGLVRLTRAADGVASLVGAGQAVSAAALPLPTPLMMTPEHLGAVRGAIAAGREPWAGSWTALRQRAEKWLTPPAALPAVVEVPAYRGDNAVAVSAGRVAVADATQPALGLALVARLGNDERAAAAAVQRILAWLPVRLEGPDADVVACSSTIALVQAADLLRGMPAWTAHADAAFNAWITGDLAPRATRLATHPNIRVRWWSRTTAMTLAAWRGDHATVRTLMASMRQEVAAACSPAVLPSLLAGAPDDKQLLHCLILALQCADLARNATGDATPPPPEWNTAVSAFIARHAQAPQADDEKTFFMRALVGPGPWRTPAAQPFVVGPDPARQVAFGWYFPTLTARDPRR